MLCSPAAATASDLKYVSFTLLDHLSITSEILGPLGRRNSQLLLQGPLALALLDDQAALSRRGFDKAGTPLQLERRRLRWTLDAASLLSLLLLFWRHRGLLVEPWLLAAFQIGYR